MTLNYPVIHKMHESSKCNQCMYAVEYDENHFSCGLGRLMFCLFNNNYFFKRKEDFIDESEMMI